MLAWLFRRVPHLRLVPGLPALFDAFLLAGTALFYRERFAALHQIERAVLSWPGITVKIHRFGGTEFNLGPREVGHLHGNGLLDIPFTKALRDEIVSAGEARPHHIFPRSAWISYSVRSKADLPGAISLLRRNYERWQKSDSGQV
jgi:hypothetical protein